MKMKIEGGINCLNDNPRNNSVASGVVFFIPPEKKVLLDSFSETDEFTENRVRHLKTNVPHVILCNHYADMSLNIPGGKVERNENLVDTANREWSEEIMGIPNYTLDGEKIFNETHFKFKKIDGYFKIYTFIKIIRSREKYKKLVSDMNNASLGMLEPNSKWGVTDSMGGVSVPIFMEPSYNNNRYIGFPKLLHNVRYPHRISLVLCILDGGHILNKEEEKDLLSKWCHPRIEYINYSNGLHSYC